MPTNSRRLATRRLPVEELFLDPENPRVLVDTDPSQLDLIIYLYEREALDELVTSFVENGYFVEEPLVAVKKGGDFVVVEGNRRLATLKLLLDGRLRSKVGAEGWPTLSKAQRARLEQVPVVVHRHRSDVMAFLGYRHITGAKKWAPFQKSRFVAQLVEEGQDLEEVQALIGDTTQAVKKLYQEYVVFRQISQDLEVDAETIRSRFSLLEVALGQRPIKTYLGLPRSLPTEAVEALVPDDRLEELEQVVGWVFGTGRWPLVIDDSRDINRKLAKIIGNEEARRTLIETGDLDFAWDMTDGEQQSLLRRLASAERSIRDASGVVSVYADDPSVKEAVIRLATMIDGLKKVVK